MVKSIRYGHVNSFMIGWKGGVRTPWTSPPPPPPPCIHLCSVASSPIEFFPELQIIPVGGASNAQTNNAPVVEKVITPEDSLPRVDRSQTSTCAEQGNTERQDNAAPHQHPMTRTHLFLYQTPIIHSAVHPVVETRQSFTELKEGEM